MPQARAKRGSSIFCSKRRGPKTSLGSSGPKTSPEMPESGFPHKALVRTSFLALLAFPHSATGWLSTALCLQRQEGPRGSKSFWSVIFALVSGESGSQLGLHISIGVVSVAERGSNDFCCSIWSFHLRETGFQTATGYQTCRLARAKRGSRMRGRTVLSTRPW